MVFVFFSESQSLIFERMTDIEVRFTSYGDDSGSSETLDGPLEPHVRYLAYSSSVIEPPESYG